ncbi:uncharacterized protein J3D65DRAFT_624420 [Phyllosticta citribraziliensis]|uniref:Secreted protein n=1 Tax=Phyllosticta citribraziliensis TaxID=989973 RepID=A0ABR1LPK8_9PEZI
MLLLGASVVVRLNFLPFFFFSASFYPPAGCFDEGGVGVGVETRTEILTAIVERFDSDCRRDVQICSPAEAIVVAAYSTMDGCCDVEGQLDAPVRVFLSNQRRGAVN